MREYFVRANSFAAPLMSDQSTAFVGADSAAEALRQFADSYNHPAGLYSAAAYASADAFHKGEPLLATWLSNHAKALRDARPGVYTGLGPGRFEADGKIVTVVDPLAGAVVEEEVA